MPNTRLATLRYQALDRCFSDWYCEYYIEDLLEAVNRTLDNNSQPRVSKRTVQYDIRDMEANHDWDVVFVTPARNGGRRFYRYEAPNYSIWKNDLNEQQLEQLKSLMLLLQQFHGLPQFERIQEILGQLEEKYGFELESPQSVIAFDTNEEAAGVEHLSPLFEAIISKQPLHPSQRNRRASEGIIELKVIPNRELYQLLLAYGPDLEVLEPEDIRQKMAEFAGKMAEKYKTD